MSDLEHRVDRLERTVAEEQRLRVAMDGDISGLMAMRRSVVALSEDVRDLRDEFHEFREETRAGLDHTRAGLDQARASIEQTRAGIDETRAGLRVIIGLLSPEAHGSPDQASS